MTAAMVVAEAGTLSWVASGGGGTLYGRFNGWGKNKFKAKNSLHIPKVSCKIQSR